MPYDIHYTEPLRIKQLPQYPWMNLGSPPRPPDVSRGANSGAWPSQWQQYINDGQLPSSILEEWKSISQNEQNVVVNTVSALSGNVEASMPELINTLIAVEDYGNNPVNPPTDAQVEALFTSILQQAFRNHTNKASEARNYWSKLTPENKYKFAKAWLTDSAVAHSGSFSNAFPHDALTVALRKAYYGQTGHNTPVHHPGGGGGKDGSPGMVVIAAVALVVGIVLYNNRSWAAAKM